MFIIKPTSLIDLHSALLLCSSYKVNTHIYSDNGKPETLEVHVTANEESDDPESSLRLCEFAFQINFHQSGKYICSKCLREIEKSGNGNGTCGHLTFTRLINR